MEKAIKRKCWIGFLLAWALLASSIGQAQTNNTTDTAADQTKKLKKKSAKGPKKVMVSFDEDLVEGSLTGTELFLIMQKKQTQFGNLFELRENFIPEMYENIEKLK